jgi:hypothetical protein
MTTPDIAGLSRRLRCRVLEYNDRQGHYAYIGDDCALDDRVADALERQAAEIKRLRGVLTMAKGPLGSTGPTPVYEAVLAALTGEES